MITVAFDGPDGSGKSPCLAVVADALAKAGLSVHVCAPYRGTDVYPLWSTDPLRAAATVRDAIDRDLEIAAKDARDVVLYDRHWPTAAVSTTSWRAVDLIRQSTLDHLFLLIPREPRQKAGNDPDRGEWMVNGVDSHWIAYRCLAEGYMGVHRPRPNKDDLFDFRQIAWEVERCCGV